MPLFEECQNVQFVFVKDTASVRLIWLSHTLICMQMWRCECNECTTYPAWPNRMRLHNGWHSLNNSYFTTFWIHQNLAQKYFSMICFINKTDLNTWNCAVLRLSVEFFLPRHGVSKAFETLSIFWKLNFQRKFQTKCKIFRIKNYDGVAKKGNSSPQVSPVFHKRNLVKVSQIPAY